MGIECIRVEREDELEQAVDASISAAFVAERGVALILTQKFLGEGVLTMTDLPSTMTGTICCRFRTWRIPPYRRAGGGRPKIPR